MCGDEKNDKRKDRGRHKDKVPHGHEKVKTTKELKDFEGVVWGCLSQMEPSWPSPVRYVLKIHFFIEFGPKMIQFKIQFKTKSKIFIQKNIHSKQNPKYSFKKIFIQ